MNDFRSARLAGLLNRQGNPQPVDPPRDRSRESVARLGPRALEIYDETIAARKAAAQTPPLPQDP
jgi:hypothetical protein